jgi:peptide/nickel transport system substrate-binding protein
VFDAAAHLPGVYRVTLPPSTSWNNLMLNFRNPAVAFLRDVRVRDAMADAIDQKNIVALAGHGLGVADYGPVPTVQTNFLSPAMRRGVYPVGYDPAKAAALLHDSGFAPGADGVMQKDGVRLSFVDLVPTGDAQIEQEAEILQAEFRKAGIEMKIHELDFNELLALTAGPPGGWQAAEFAETANNFPSGESMFASTGYYNQGGYSNVKMDALIDDSVRKPGLDGLFAFEDYASAQQPVIFFETDGIAILARDRIHGVADFVDPAGWFSPDQLYCTGPAAS